MVQGFRKQGLPEAKLYLERYNIQQRLRPGLIGFKIWLLWRLRPYPQAFRVFPSPGAEKHAIHQIQCPRLLQGWATHPMRRWVFTPRTGPLSWRLARRTARLRARP